MKTMIGSLRPFRTLMSVIFITFALAGAPPPTLPLHLQDGLSQGVDFVGPAAVAGAALIGVYLMKIPALAVSGK